MRIFAAVWVLMLWLTVSCQAAPISAAMRAEDARLEKTVTLTAERIYVGDLLEQMQKQTGVVLIAGDKDRVAGGPVTVVLHDVALGDAMNALYSLFSYKQASWSWRRGGNDQTGFSYTLQRPRAAQTFVDDWQKQVRERFYQAMEKCARTGKLGDFFRASSDGQKQALVFAQELNDA